jgi:phosphohistidine swiveling domain-containing protein
VRARYLIDIRQSRGRQGMGTKAEMLGLLHRYGLPVPSALCCPMEAWQRYRLNDPQLLPALRSELSRFCDPNVSYAVRSSANVEDHLESSFAGQFASVLDVQGIDNLLNAVVSVWNSASSCEAREYARKLRGTGEGIQMGVIVQQMVNATVSGVAFSRNPMTGLDEVVVEAIQGRGDEIVQRGVTPDRWVNKWGGWTARPERSSIPESLIRNVVDGARLIERRYGRPVDLEWAYDGRSLSWLQMREITSIRNLNIYSEKISREMLPGMIKPLIWSVNIPLVNGAWVKILTELIGKNNLDPRSLARQFYYRAYFNMGAFGEIFALLGMPRDSLELLMGIEVEGGEKPRFKPTLRTVRHLGRMTRFARHKWTISADVERFIAEAGREYASFIGQAVESLSPEEIFAAIDRLFVLNQRTAYYNIIVPLVMQMYHRSFKGILRRLGVDYERFDMACASDDEIDPNVALASLHAEYERLDESLRSRIRGATYEGFLRMEGIAEFQSAFEEFLRRFGHLSDVGVDFSAVPWRETPDLVLRMVTAFSAPPIAGNKIGFEQLKVRGLRRAWARLMYGRARQFLSLRARVGALYTLGYGLFRRCFLALADECLRRGVFSERDDVFYLSHEEIRSIFGDGGSAAEYRQKISRRRQEMEELRDVTVPNTIYGDDPPPLRKERSGDLKGIPTSRGYYRGSVRVIRGIQEYDRLKEGDVLVIPFSDVGLTPLFARAGAVIAESGGILSHSSIIAREYGIPAVVSVPGACQLADDTSVGVDGYTGNVVIFNLEKGEPKK